MRPASCRKALGVVRGNHAAKSNHNSMGDRANIVIKSRVHMQYVPLFIYSHWDGLGGMFEKLKKAMQRKQRWHDESYLTRIIFETVLSRDPGSENGFGIGLSMPDNQYPFLVVDVNEQSIYLVGEDEDGEFDPGMRPIKSWTFEEFTTATLEWEVIQA